MGRAMRTRTVQFPRTLLSTRNGGYVLPITGCVLGAAIRTTPGAPGYESPREAATVALFRARNRRDLRRRGRTAGEIRAVIRSAHGIRRAQAPGPRRSARARLVPAIRTTAGLPRCPCRATDRAGGGDRVPRQGLPGLASDERIADGRGEQSRRAAPSLPAWPRRASRAADRAGGCDRVSARELCDFRKRGRRWARSGP